MEGIAAPLEARSKRKESECVLVRLVQLIHDWIAQRPDSRAVRGNTVIDTIIGGCDRLGRTYAHGSFSLVSLENGITAARAGSSREAIIDF